MEAQAQVARWRAKSSATKPAAAAPALAASFHSAQEQVKRYLANRGAKKAATAGTASGISLPKVLAFFANGILFFDH